MNAVNLIPADARGRRVSLSTSPPTLGLIGGLILVLLGAVLYVSAANKVTARTSELARVSAAASAWNAAAGRYSDSVQEVAQRGQELSQIRQLASGRYPWSELLSELGGLMPTDAELSSLQATTANASSTGTSSSTSGTSSSTSGTSSSATGTNSSSASTDPIPAVELSGCAASQSAVADTMVRLHQITGVSDVTLSSSTSGTAGGSSSGSGTGSAATSGGGGCSFPVQFQISLTFRAARSSGSATSAAGAATPGTTGSAGTPATATATSTTAAAQ